jgi:hypothetical protein
MLHSSICITANVIAWVSAAVGSVMVIHPAIRSLDKVLAIPLGPIRLLLISRMGLISLYIGGFLVCWIVTYLAIIAAAKILMRVRWRGKLHRDPRWLVGGKEKGIF